MTKNYVSERPWAQRILQMSYFKLCNMETFLSVEIYGNLSRSLRSITPLSRTWCRFTVDRSPRTSQCETSGPNVLNETACWQYRFTQKYKGGLRSGDKDNLSRGPVRKIIWWSHETALKNIPNLGKRVKKRPCRKAGVEYLCYKVNKYYPDETNTKLTWSLNCPCYVEKEAQRRHY